MLFKLYVGNYPSDFTEDDVKELFKDFKGLKFASKHRRQVSKCFSFFTCTEMDVLVAVIRDMHNKDVFGRRLVVRASDTSLQEYVDMLLQEENNDVTSDSLNRSFEKDRGTETETTLETPKDSPVKEVPPFQSTTRKKFSRGAKHVHNPRQPRSVSGTSPTPSTESQVGEYKHASEYSNASEYNNASGYNNVSEYYATGGCKSELGSLSPRSSKNSSFRYDYDSLTWLSVTNFRFGTTVRSLYELFLDYNPIKVFMICNFYSPDGDLTEAFVGFENRDVADDVIMNFDNTLFKGRVILVNDINDLSTVEELLDICHS